MHSLKCTTPRRATSPQHGHLVIVNHGQNPDHRWDLTSYSCTKITFQDRFIKVRCIIGDAIFLKLTKNVVRNLAISCGTIWRCIEKLQYRCTTTILTCIIAPKMFWKIYVLYDFSCAQNFSFWAVFELPTLTIAVCAMYRHAEKILYRCTSTFSVLNYCSRIFFKSLSYLNEVVYTNVSTNFWTFRNLTAISQKNVAPPRGRNENYIVHLKVQTLVKKTLKTSSKLANKQQHNACSNDAPLKRTVLRTRSMTKKQKTPYFHTYSRRSLFISPKLCTVVDLVVPIIKGATIFQSNS